MANGITYWLDEAEIGWGDRITEKINGGLAQSRVVVVFLSDAFLQRRWPQTELGSALNLEAATGEVLVLPLLLAPDSVVFAQYPLHRDKHFQRWEAGVPVLVAALQKRLGVAYQSAWSHCHPAAYSGKVWIQIVPRPENRALEHEYSVRWGPWHYRGILQSTGNESLCLWHMKRDDGQSDPIFFSITPACYVVFGQSNPPLAARDINHGWEKVQGA
ncbi:MAG: toll/interleukin-1 receptor domain-containing protein [Acidobacteria bacterium]|nr:toll/interleukin-1 receptor domain-containing protein [Acidobacteriota bacterium]MBI3657571.1 toll/interleukin-1 receptor domain-containing protein [Acidobacteriota bacterium]